MLERLEADDRADRVVLERQVVDVLDTVDTGSFLDVCTDVVADPEELAQIGDVFLTFGRPRPDLYQRLGKRELLGNVTGELERSIPQGPAT
jgi:hypothetical protein